MKLDVSAQTIEECRALASAAVDEVQAFVNDASTPGVERAVARLLGVEGLSADGIPLVNELVDKLSKAGRLHEGVASWLGRATHATNLTSSEIARRVSDGSIDVADERYVEGGHVEAIRLLVKSGYQRIHARRREREAFLDRFGESTTPWLYVIVATGNIHEDIVQAKMAACQGADVIAVIRSTAQSLMDHVPEGLTTEGFGGTFATQANFRLMRRALDEVSEDLGRYIRLTNYASGLCMAEMAVLGAFERLDMMLSDSMYGILFRNINPERTFVDQHFARSIQGLAGMIINTGEDNYLTTTDSLEAAPTVLASQFLNEQFALRSGLTPAQIGLGNAFEMHPDVQDGLLLQMADALLSRTCFPDAPLKYMPPTRWKDGDIFQAHVIDALFNLASVATSQTIHLVGILSEGVHTPFLHDRFQSIKNAKYVMNYAATFNEEFEPRPNGVLNSRASQVMISARNILKRIEVSGVFNAIESGDFGDVSRPRNRGVGSETTFRKGKNYVNVLDTDLFQEASSCK